VKYGVNRSTSDCGVTNRSVAGRSPNRSAAEKSLWLAEARTLGRL
jgi:hypothetical protein